MFKIFNLFKIKKLNSVVPQGRFELICRDKDGNIKWKVKKHNLIVNVGKAQLALLAGATGSLFTFLAVGSSNTAPAATQNALGSEFATNGLSRVAATVSRVTTNVTNDTLQLSASWSVIGGGGDVEEIGIFNASSSGVMLGRALSGSRLVVSGDTLTATYQVTFS